ncbi:MAG: MBL fold metallo-hydrolase [Candidatus Zixiibacteriota bacterium]|nr:MAG: MBL fold metallo-hydrolase [candidate division Zixibacteria bacterium]
MILKTLVVGLLETNCYILGDEKTKEAVVIDPGEDFEEIDRQLRGSELKVTYIVLTHGHFDHTGALARLKASTGAEVLIHEKDAPMLSPSGQAQPVLLDSGADPCAADRTLKEGDRIQFGENTLEILHTPGHTPGEISLVTDKMIFTGDTLFCGSVGRTDLAGGSYQKLIESIKEKLLTRGDDYLIYPGHGPASSIGEERRSNPFLTGV